MCYINSLPDSQKLTLMYNFWKYYIRSPGISVNVHVKQSLYLFVGMLAGIITCISWISTDKGSRASVAAEDITECHEEVLIISPGIIEQILIQT